MATASPPGAVSDPMDKEDRPHPEASYLHATYPVKVGFVLLFLALIAAPFFAYPVFLMQALCFALFASAFNLLIGYAGLLSFGHAMFLGTAGYVGAHAAKVWGLDPIVSILCGVAASAALGLLTGVIAIRRQGIYFAMITLALAQMVYFVYLQAPFTHGEDGITAVPARPVLGFIDLSKGLKIFNYSLSSEVLIYYFVLAVYVLGIAIIYRTVNSPFGEVLKSVRENEPRAVSLGYRTERYKLAAFILSAALAGLAGATKSIALGNASLTDVHWSMSGEVVLMTLLGGLGTLIGPTFGAFIIVAMQQYLAPFGSWVTVIQGVIFVICVLAFRRGIIGEVARLIGRDL